MNSSANTFHNILTDWYLTHKRSMPWRKTSDPYRIWVSEILLQQTQVSQGLPYYIAFLEAFPTVFDLAKAPEQKVLKLWQGLGYYSRARNLHHSAKHIARELNGVFPQTYSEIIQLKGVGDYTASAIASICFAEPTAVVDGNVYRVLSRLFGISIPINSTPGQKEFKALAEKLISHKNPGKHNQALMEFGALQCRPKNPDCTSCPFQDSCVAFREERISALPVKLKKTKVRIRHLNYLVLVTETQDTLVEQRTGKGIWENLFQFPLIESEQELGPKEISEKSHVFPWAKKKEISPFHNKPIKHLLSHQKLMIRFWKIASAEPKADELSDKMILKPIAQLNEFPVPVPVQKFIDQFLFSK